METSDRSPPKEETDKYVMRISVTSRCNLNCNYCSPDRANRETMTDDDILGIIESGVKAGVKKVSWTGGEPTIRRSIIDLITGAKELGVSNQSMTTNGVTFGNRVQAFKEAGLDRVNISLETLDRKKYKEITGVDALEKVILALREAVKFFHRVKINCVITKDNIGDIPHFVNFAQEFETLIIRFLEVVPCENDYEKDKAFFDIFFVSIEEIMQTLKEMGDLIPEKIVGHVPKSRYFRLQGKKGIFGVNPNHSVDFHCDRRACTKIRVNPQGIVSNCTTDLSFCRDFSGLTQDAKDELMVEIVREKVARNYKGFRHKQKYYDFWRFGKQQVIAILKAKE